MDRRLVLIAVAWFVPVCALLVCAWIREDLRTAFFLSTLTFGLGWGVGLWSGWWLNDGRR